MRYIYIIPLTLLLFITSCSQLTKSNEIKVLSSKVDSLSTKVDSLSAQNKMMEDEFTWIENELVDLHNMKETKPEATAKTEQAVTAPSAKAAEKASNDWQCLAITNAGTRCSRPAVKESKYCWQHKKTYEPDKPDKKVTPAKSDSLVPKK